MVIVCVKEFMKCYMFWSHMAQVLTDWLGDMHEVLSFVIRIGKLRAFQNIYFVKNIFYNQTLQRMYIMVIVYTFKNTLLECWCYIFIVKKFQVRVLITGVSGVSITRRRFSIFCELPV